MPYPTSTPMPKKAAPKKAAPKKVVKPAKPKAGTPPTYSRYGTNGQGAVL